MKANKFALSFALVAFFALCWAAACSSPTSTNTMANVGNRGVNSPSSGNSTSNATNGSNTAANRSGH